MAMVIEMGGGRRRCHGCGVWRGGSLFYLYIRSLLPVMRSLLPEFLHRSPVAWRAVFVLCERERESEGVCVCVCVCVCVYTHTHTHTHVCMYTYTLTYVHTHT